MATIKIKRKGKWVKVDDVPALKEQETPKAEPPAVAVEALPEKAQVDPDTPLQQLWFEHPEVRAYLAKDGRMRSGLTPEQEETARKILARYGN